LKWIKHERRDMFDLALTLLVEMPIELLREFPLGIYAIC